MDHLLVLLLLLWSSGVQAEGKRKSTELRLMGENSRCAGRLEMKHVGEWRQVSTSTWTQKEPAVFCRELDCGSAVSINKKESPLEYRPVLWFRSDCAQSGSALRECVTLSCSSHTLNLICSDLLFQPNSSVSSVHGVSEDHQQGFQVFRGSSFTISCSIQPQYKGGSFHLTFTSSSNAEHKYTQAAVNHSAHFTFPAAEPAHQGNYTCVYQVYVFSHNFSSESHQLFLSVSDPTVFLLRVVVLPLTLLLLSAALYLYSCVYWTEQRRKQDVTSVLSCLSRPPGGRHSPDRRTLSW